MVSPLNTVSVSRSVGRFMDNLQTEVLEIEFLSYSKGMTTISEEDFARILLRYTTVENITGYLENVRQSIPDEKVLCFFSGCGFGHEKQIITQEIQMFGLCLSEKSSTGATFIFSVYASLHVVWNTFGKPDIYNHFVSIISF